MPPSPPGFVENDGRLPNFYIPFKGSQARARYVQVFLSEGLHAEGTMGGRAPKSTPPLSKPFHQSNLMMPPHPNPSPSGSSTSSMLQRPTLKSYLREHKSSTTGDSPLTWPAIEGTATKLTISMQPERGSMPALPPVEGHKILPSTASALPKQPRGFVTSNDWKTLWETSVEKSS